MRDPVYFFKKLIYFLTSYTNTTIKNMGVCFSLCSIVCCKHSYFSHELSRSICTTMEKQLGTIIQTKIFSMDRWYVSLSKDTFSQYHLALDRRLRDVVRSMGLPVLNMSGFAMDHLIENMSYYIIKTLMDDDYKSSMNDNAYTILDLPNNSVFHQTPKIEISSTSIENFNKKIYTITNRENKVELLQPDNTDKGYHKVFDSNLQTQLIKNLEDITDEKLVEILGSVYNRFTKQEEDEKRLLQNNII
jgi:hypothetical protein